MIPMQVTSGGSCNNADIQPLTDSCILLVFPGSRWSWRGHCTWGTPAFSPQRFSLFLSLGSCSDSAGMFQPVSPVCFSNSEKNTGRMGGCQLCFLLYKESFV